MNKKKNKETASIRVYSPFNVKQTLEFVAKRFDQASTPVHVMIDHAKNAKEQGIVMIDMVTVLFGNPQLYSELLEVCPAMSYDMPFRLSIYQDSIGVVWLEYPDIEELAIRHKIEGNPIIPRIQSYLDHMVDMINKVSP